MGQNTLENLRQRYRDAENNFRNSYREELQTPDDTSTELATEAYFRFVQPAKTEYETALGQN